MSRRFDEWYFSSGEYLLEPGMTEWVELRNYPGYYIWKVLNGQRKHTCGYSFVYK